MQGRYRGARKKDYKDTKNFENDRLAQGLDHGNSIMVMSAHIFIHFMYMSKIVKLYIANACKHVSVILFTNKAKQTQNQNTKRTQPL